MRNRHQKTGFLIVLTCLICSFVQSQIFEFGSQHPYKKVFVETDNFGPSYLDSLEQGYTKIKTDSVRFSILNDLAYYWHTRNLNTAMDFTKKGLRKTAEKGDAIWQGRFQITQGAILLRMEKLDSAQTVLESAKNKVTQSDLAFLNTQLGYVYERRGQLDKAADYAMVSLNLGTKLKDKKAKAMALSDLSNLFWKQAKYELALDYGERSLKLFDAWGITDLDYDFTLYLMGNNYLALKDYEKARTYYEHSIIIGERYGFYNNLSDVYISLVDLYSYLGEFEKADAAGRNAIKYAELLENNFMVMRSWLSVGKMQNMRGNYPEAIEGLKKSIAIATEDFGDAYYLSQAYKELGRAYASNHDYQNAFRAFSEYDTLKSKVFTAAADRHISQLTTKYDIAQKEGTILLQKSQIKKQQTRQELIIIIIILLLLLLGLAYNTITSNVRKNRLLQKQNSEKEFLLKEIHHRVKNNLEIVSSLLSLQSAQINDADILDAMKQSQHRVHSMGMIHQNLYMGENLAAIEMKEYFSNLSDYIINAFGKNEQVTVAVKMDRLELDIDTAIPIGLIVNELITNSLKYAFPNDRQGNIYLGLKRKRDILFLEVKDNGIGIGPARQNYGSGFGTQLVNLLVKQLDGKMVMKTNLGTAVYIEFQLLKAA